MRHFPILLPMLLLAACGGSRQPTALNDRPTLGVAEAAMTGGSPEIAVNVTRSILTREPYNIPAQMMLGRALYALRLYPEGAAAYNVVLKLQPENAAAHLGLGRIKLADHDPKAAEEQFRRAAQLELRPETLNNLGIALDLQHRPTEAQAEYRRALQLDPGSAATRLNLALSLLASGNASAARAALPPDSPENGRLAPEIAAAQRAIEGRSGNVPIPSATRPGMPHASD